MHNKYLNSIRKNPVTLKSDTWALTTEQDLSWDKQPGSLAHLRIQFVFTFRTITDKRHPEKR